MDELNFEWVNFYMEFADKLLEYKNNRRELINIIVQSFDELDMDFPKVEADEDGNKIIPIDIDPFTIFALFNRQTKEETRTKITTKFKEKFSLNANVPLIYDGITVVNNLATNFYSYKDERGNEDIDNLWNLFECAIELSDNHENVCLTEYGRKWIERNSKELFASKSDEPWKNVPEDMSSTGDDLFQTFFEVSDLQKLLNSLNE